jgi:hypothetical protein
MHPQLNDNAQFTRLRIRSTTASACETYRSEEATDPRKLWPNGEGVVQFTFSFLSRTLNDIECRSESCKRRTSVTAGWQCGVARCPGEGYIKFQCQAYHWAKARIKIARMTLTIKLDRNWSSFQLANSAPPLSVTDSAIAPSARILKTWTTDPSQNVQSNKMLVQRTGRGDPACFPAG